jgi:hypothetical protein
MANTLKYVREIAPIEQTPKNKGLMLRLEIGDYDNDIITFNGEPIGGMGGKFTDRALAAQSVNRLIGQALEELFKQSAQRKASQ